MMQNSPLLVTQASPIKGVTSSANHQTHQEPNESFEHVLSKQVKQEETKTPAAKNGDTKGKDDDKQSAADTSIEETADTAIDAQSLAKEVTAKTLKEVTDGEVVIDTPQESNVLQAPLANIAATIQTATQQVAAGEAKTVDTKTLNQWKQSMTDISTEKGLDEKENGQLQANPLKDTNASLNQKLTNVFATDSKQPVSEDSLVETNIKVVSDIAAVSSQAAVTKPVSSLASSPLQAGASNVINAFPGKTGWNDAVSQKVVWMVGAAEQSATLTLNPKDLGPLQVIINVNNEKADATFISENPEVRKALEEGMSSLRNAMGQAGVELGQANVNTGKQQQESREQSARQATTNDAFLADDNLGSSPVNTRVSNGLVDTFA